MFSDILQCNRGTTTIEYALFAAMAAILITSGITTLGESVGKKFDLAAGAFAAETNKDHTAKSSSGNSRMIHIKEESRDPWALETEKAAD
jgi:Flp pilus assembly pilin Flp